MIRRESTLGSASSTVPGNKARLGANAILSVSLAAARAAAAARGIWLYEHLADLAGPPRR